MNKKPERSMQGYPQSMRLKRRLYGICLIIFSYIHVPCRLKPAFSFLNHFLTHLNTKLKVKNPKQASNRHVLSVFGRLYSLTICGESCIYNTETYLDSYDRVDLEVSQHLSFWFYITYSLILVYSPGLCTF